MSSPAFTIRHAAFCGCLLLAVFATLARAGEDLIYVEPQRSRTFGPQRVTPAGTVFHIKVLAKADHNSFRLHRCGDPCKTAETVKVWQAADYRAGDELSWRVERDGTYYLWNQDARDERSLEATTHWFVGKRVRIAFESGAVIEAWYVMP
jgi:hypothetical protein